MYYADATFEPGGHLVISAEQGERGIYLVEGSLQVDGGLALTAGRLIVLAGSSDVTIRAGRGARAMLLGGKALDGERHIWWNFVASTTARIDRAARQWAEHGFPGVPGDDERIPLPPA